MASATREAFKMGKKTPRVHRHARASKKECRFIKMHKNNFIKLCVTLAFLIALNKGRRIGTRSGRAGPSFSVRPEKEAKGAVLHGTSAAERWRHVKTRSANLPKLNASRRFKHMGRFVFALRAKIPSRATQ